MKLEEILQHETINAPVLQGRLNGGFKRGELYIFAAFQTPRPFSRETVEFLEGTLARRREAQAAYDKAIESFDWS